MQGRSWMAALTLAVGSASTFALPALAADKPAAASKVNLLLRVAGLKRGGCDVVIKPGFVGSFRPVTRHIDLRGELNLTIDDVSTDSADRECDFAITIREPGQRDKTFHRGLRLSAPQRVPVVNSLQCNLNSPSSIATAAAAKDTRRK